MSEPTDALGKLTSWMRWKAQRPLQLFLRELTQNKAAPFPKLIPK